MPSQLPAKPMPQGGLMPQKPEVVQGNGLFPGKGSGRADTVEATVPSGAYMVPADVVSSLGDGNTEAGAKVLDRLIPQAPGQNAQQGPMAKGGPVRPAPQVGGNAGQPVPIMASNGEYLVAPERVAALGAGDINYGHDILDQLVESVRTKTVKKLKSMPRPKT